MFGINDNDQNNNPAAPAGQPQNGPAPLPPSPFMDSPADDHTPNTPEPQPQPHDAPQTDLSAPPTPIQNGDALVNLKEQALNSLAPLVNHLDQTPEEKFKTTMMLIQASDNSSLVKQAYEAANQISDEKARAQALLDVVNEINYFTQKESEDKN